MMALRVWYLSRTDRSVGRVDRTSAFEVMCHVSGEVRFIELLMLGIQKRLLCARNACSAPSVTWLPAQTILPSFGRR